ncbi:GGDEF domain-containing protein [Tepidiphilus thermophilus]|uniref:diguanylate cyclase n=1 Tax=Tepidiphilus thermophilus TaxID=876478 RepID=A0A0K6IRG1_9PROT|nr:GGDEF domain-containing protein [Tepidiphilus thermophilus]CUB05673.1 diguanylate cyclase (GGDEF) domain [Tepidiphilus thermophilus]
MPSSPVDLAKETLLRLAQLQQPPTPENYTRIYCELAGEPELLPPRLVRLLELVVAKLPRTGERTCAALARARDHLKRNETAQALADVEEALLALPPAHETEVSWVPLIRRLIDAWEHAAPGWTPERKLHALETILEEGQSRWLPRRLERFIAGLRQPPGETSSAPAAAPEIDTAALTGALLELLAHTMHALELVGGDNDGIRAELGRLRHELLQPATALTPQVVRLLQERLDALLDPLQCTLERKRAAEAELKRLLADFLSQLGQMSRETEQYQSQLQQAATAIEQADDLASVAGELRTLLQATRHMSETTRQAHEALERTRREAEDADAKVRELEAQLQSLNERLVRDSLTGLYNRNGLEATFSRTIETLRQGSIPSLTLGVIDLDDFKRINDLFGHQAGDDSLKFLAEIARQHLREHDVIGRYGGEEFVVILPGTTAENAAEILRRLQRILTREIFFHDDRHRVVTFSAGVTEVYPDDGWESAFERADQAMYRAKRAGKNRVFVADT